MYPERAIKPNNTWNPYCIGRLSCRKSMKQISSAESVRSEDRGMGVPEGTFIAASCLVSLMGGDQSIMKRILGMLTEETVTVEVPSTGNDAQDKYTSECVKQELQMTSPSSQWWDTTVRVTISVPYFGTVEHVANLSLAHCAAAVGSVELLYKCKDPHVLLEMACDATTLHLAACFDHIFYLSQFSGMAITPYELRVALSRPDKKKRSIMHYACSNGHTTFLNVALGHLPYKNMLTPLLQMSDANGCTPTSCAVVGNHVDVLRLLDSRHLFKDHTVYLNDNNNDDKISNVAASLAHLACEYGCANVLEFLHEKNCDLDRLSSKGRTPAMVAAKSGKLKIIKLLLSWKVSMETVPEMAIAWIRCDILQCLADSGVDVTPIGRDVLKMEEVKREMDERGAKLAATQPPKQTVSAAVSRVVESWDGEYWVEAAHALDANMQGAHTNASVNELLPVALNDEMSRRQLPLPSNSDSQSVANNNNGTVAALGVPNPPLNLPAPNPPAHNAFAFNAFRIADTRTPRFWTHL